MTSRRKISIEVRRDSATPQASDEGVAEGIKPLQEIYGDIALVDKGELLFVAPHWRRTVSFAKQPKIPSDSDMIMVLSERPFQGNTPERHVYGKTYSYTKAKGAIAMIDVRVTPPEFIQKVVTHEAMHLFGVKETGEHYDGKDHCTDNSCLLQPSIDGSVNCICDECKVQLEEYSLDIAAASRQNEKAKQQSTKLCCMAQAAFNLGTLPGKE
jgi:hypothetical protein